LSTRVCPQSRSMEPLRPPKFARSWGRTTSWWSVRESCTKCNLDYCFSVVYFFVLSVAWLLHFVLYICTVRPYLLVLCNFILRTCTMAIFRFVNHCPVYLITASSIKSWKRVALRMSLSQISLCSDGEVVCCSHTTISAYCLRCYGWFDDEFNL